MNIIVPSSPMRLKPDDLSSLETECLFGEFVEVFEKYSEWAYCKLLTDNYCGWIKITDLGQLPPFTHRVKSNRSFLYKEKDIKSNCLHYLPLGAQLSINKVQGNWAEVLLSNKHKFFSAYVPNKHIIKVNLKINDWVSIAEGLIGTPYKWGGRDSLGLDCSALLQLSYQTYGKNIPRNTLDQIQVKTKTINNINELERGYVVFWEGHVGIMVDKLNCIHGNAFHMEVIVEPLNKITARMRKGDEIIEIKDFN